MAWTLAELSKIETDPLRKSVADTLLMEASMLQLIPWETIGKLSTTVVKMGTLPSVGFRKVNAGYTESTGNFLHNVENIALLGGMIDTDKAIARAQNTIADARAIQQTMMVKAIAYEFNDKFINGNPISTTPDGFKGLKQRVTDLNTDGYTEQYVDGGSTSTNRGFLYSDAEGHYMLDKLDTLIYGIKGHKPDMLLMNKKCMLAIRSVLRRVRLLDQSKDMFDRIVDMYMGIPMIDIGVKADQTTEIIPNDETVSGGTEETSIYAVKLGIGDFMWGIQEYPLEVTDKGLLEAKPVYRTEVDWPLGLAMIDPRSIGRLYGLVPDADAS